MYCWCFPLCFLFDPLFLVSTFFCFFYFQNLSSLLNFPMSDLSFTHQIMCYLLTFSPVCSSFPACLLLPFRHASWSEIAWLSKIIFEVTEHFSPIKFWNLYPFQSLNLILKSVCGVLEENCCLVFAFCDSWWTKYIY